MPTSKARTARRVVVRPPARADQDAFLAAALASRRLHVNWVKSPLTPAQFALYLRRYDGGQPTHAGFVVVRKADSALVGVFNVSEIVRGSFRSAYLGYYAFAGTTGQGYMREGMAQVLDQAFGRLKLHRIEVNVQPTNARSIALVTRLGFTREGFSRRYVKIAGRWRDHVRFAMLAEDWRKLRRKAR